ncbi:MAG: aconitate hydratase AcnA, partial [Elusimicrobiota bacterium]
ITGSLPSGVTATDAVLTVTEMLRKKGVVGKFVEFYGRGLDALSLADRATIANMAPEYGATMGFFPVDANTLAYLRQTGRVAKSIDFIERYLKAQGLFRTTATPDPVFNDTLTLDLGTVQPCLAGPKRPQDRVLLSDAPKAFWSAAGLDPVVSEDGKLTHGDVVIAAITSCTNTSNPSVLVAAGLLAQKAVAKGLRSKAHVKTSLSPGSRVVADYLRKAGLLKPLETLGFNIVGFGCMTCIGNSGDVPEPMASVIKQESLNVAAVLSGNRNFEGRINPLVRSSFLASPPLVVAYALAGSVGRDLNREPLGIDKNGKPVYLKDVWPTNEEIEAVMRGAVTPDLFVKNYAKVSAGDAAWAALKAPTGDLYRWDKESTYIAEPPYFKDMASAPGSLSDIRSARVLLKFGDSITTDHISPAGSIKPESAAGSYLLGRGVTREDFNSYGSRRGNHEVMVRGGF